MRTDTESIRFYRTFGTLPKIALPQLLFSSLVAGIETNILGVRCGTIIEQLPGSLLWSHHCTLRHNLLCSHLCNHFRSLQGWNYDDDDDLDSACSSYYIHGCHMCIQYHIPVCIPIRILFCSRLDNHWCLRLSLQLSLILQKGLLAK